MTDASRPDPKPVSMAQQRRREAGERAKRKRHARRLLAAWDGQLQFSVSIPVVLHRVDLEALLELCGERST